MARILIVDDSMVARYNLRNILEAAGHEVVAEAKDGEEGFALFKEHAPDLVTMDITMPKLNGIDCLKMIMDTNAEACVMMVSALGQNAKVLEALNAGARHYVTKPFAEDNVVEAINEVLNG